MVTYVRQPHDRSPRHMHCPVEFPVPCSYSYFLLPLKCPTETRELVDPFPILPGSLAQSVRGLRSCGLGPASWNAAIANGRAGRSAPVERFDELPLGRRRFLAFTCSYRRQSKDDSPVSYTHLTLPTILLV